MNTLRHPALRLLGIAATLTIGLRAIFFELAPWLWSFSPPFPAGELTPWARSQVGGNRDGIEPYACLALVAALWVLVALVDAAVERLKPSWQAAITAALLVGAVVLEEKVPLRPALSAVASDPNTARIVVVGSLLAAWLLQRVTARRGGVGTAVIVALLAICLLPTTVGSRQDLAAILAPALRSEMGFPPSQIYLQYDLFPSVLARLWSSIGGAPMSFTFICGLGFFGLFVGLFVFARRVFTRRELAAPLLVALVIVRFYAVHLDPNATPQATPIRLDLWIVLLAVAYRRGLRDWTVGLTLAALCFFSRSMGMLYVGSYLLAVAADFLAERSATAPLERPPFLSAAGAAALQIAPSLGLVVLSFVAARLVFGGFGSDAVKLYRTLGVGMLRVDRNSFFWWCLPLLGVVGWLAFSRRDRTSPRHGQAAILAVALVMANSIYFFGRSHEHNLINVSASYLLCAFWGLDLAWPAATDPRPVRALFRAAPWLLVAFCAYYYSDLVADKVVDQAALVTRQRALPAAGAVDTPMIINCEEITRAAGDGRVYFLSRDDYWFYQHCGFIPRGYIQPIALAVLKKPVMAELNQLLDGGFKLVVPQHADWAGMFAELLAELPGLHETDTPNYKLYRR